MRLIINGDDFGASKTINSAILLAHRQGVLTSASLMVTGQAVDEAVDLARRVPSLAVGLHVVLVDGLPSLSPEQIPHLVGPDGRFPASPVVAGLRCMASHAAREELRRELECQFERFSASGLLFDHVDSHMHFHIHPVVFPLVLSLAVQFGVCGLRIPRDDLSLAFRYAPAHPFQKVVWAGFYRTMSRLYRSKAKQSRLVVPERVCGLLQSGSMHEAYVLNLLQNLHAGLVELYFHPDQAEGGPPLGPNPGDLATLLSPSIRQVIAQRGLELTTYSRQRGSLN
jgi:hopanoid biosynthesis associated protein HpnK